MNIFRQEIRSHWKGLLGWSIAMVLLVVAGMAKFSAFGANSQNANQIFESFPKPVLAILGIQGLDLSQVIGYFGVMYLYIQLTATIHAAMLGAEIISKEERDKTSEFLFPKPVSRLRILTEKVLAGLVNIIVLNFVTMAVSVAIVAAFAGHFFNDNTIIMMMAGLFIMQLFFFVLGVTFASYLKNPKLPPIMTTAVLLATYVIWVVVDLNSKLDFLKYISPFKYFDASVLIRDGHLDMIFVSISLAVTTALMLSACLAFSRRDLKV